MRRRGFLAAILAAPIVPVVKVPAAAPVETPAMVAAVSSPYSQLLAAGLCRHKWNDELKPEWDAWLSECKRQVG